MIRNTLRGAFVALGIASLLALLAPSLAQCAGFARSYGGGGGSAVLAYATTVDGAGNVYVGGYFDAESISVGSQILTRLGRSDAWVAKLDSSGNTLWARNFGGAGAFAVVLGLAVDGSGNVHVAGQFQTASLSSPPLARIGGQDTFVVKLDAAGDVLWARNSGGPGTQSVMGDGGIALDAVGNVYVGGYFEQGDLTTPALALFGGAGARNAFAMKLAASDGSVVWARAFGGTGSVVTGGGIGADLAGNAYLIGSFERADLTVPPIARIGNDTIFVIKLDAGGNVGWTRAFGGPKAFAQANSVAVDAAGNIYHTGSFASADLTTPPLARIGEGGTYLAKLDPAGNLAWVRAYGGPGATAHAASVAVDAAGRVYVGGSFYNGSLTSPALASVGMTNAFVMQVDSTGETLRARPFGGPQAKTFGYVIAADADGNAYLAGGFSEGDVAFPPMTKLGLVDAFILKRPLLPATLELASSGTVEFPGQSIKTTSLPRKVTLTNGGASPAAIQSITASGAFAVSHDCPATLPPAGSCILSIVFTPTAVGTITGTLEVQGSDGLTTAPLAGTGELSLVTHFYQSILRREPDPSGKSFWESEANRMNAIGSNLNETWYSMAGAFFGSLEYRALNRTSAEYVTDLYLTFFNRHPDASGLAFWTGQIAQGMPAEVVGVAFMLSPEFSAFTQSIYGIQAVRPEVDVVMDFYRGLLGRLPDTAGQLFWVGQFRTAQCTGPAAARDSAEKISSQLATSAEYGAKGRTDAQYVGDLYNAFLRRGGDLGGVRYWIDQLAFGARTREQIRQRFLASAEFTSRVDAIVAAGCAP